LEFEYRAVAEEEEEEEEEFLERAKLATSDEILTIAVLREREFVVSVIRRVVARD
jgi:hypothetical protein